MTINSKILSIATTISLTGIYDDYTALELIQVLSLADDAYFNDDEPVLPDNLYDEVKVFAANLAGQHEYFQAVGSAVRGGKTPLPHPMPSLNQVYVGDIQEWVKKHELENKAMVLSDKLDGASGLTQHKQQVFNIGYSRGDGLLGADISRHLTKIPSVPMEINGDNLDTRGEIIISRDGFVKLQDLAKKHTTKQYANPRNQVAGLMNAKENPAWTYEHINFVAYGIEDAMHLDKIEQLQLLQYNNFLVPWHKVVFGSDLTDEFLTNILAERRAESPYDIDGIVVDVNCAQKRQEMAGDNTKNPAYSVKYKVLTDADLREATVLAVVWNVSKHGYLKPTVTISPVVLFGTTVRKATAFNAAFIRDNNIGPGTILKVTKSGMVIPFIHSVVSSTYADLPDEIEYEWNETNVDIFVSRPEDFQDITVNQLIDFFTTIKVPALKDGNIRKLCDAGYTTPDDIINLSMDEMISALGSDIIGERVYNGILTRLTDIPLFTLMGAYSTSRGIGARKIKQLYTEYGDKLLDISSIDQIIPVRGFDQKTAEKVLNEIIRFKEFFKQVQEKCSIQVVTVNADGLLSGQHIVFTGFRDSALETFIEKNGGVVQSAINKKTTLLLVADINDVSTKTKKANQLNIDIMVGSEFKVKWDVA